MSDNLRTRLIRLAHARPELRADLLPLLKEAAVSTGKTARGNNVLEAVLPSDGVNDLYDSLEKQDEQSAKLLMQVYSALQSRLQLSNNENEALNRVRDLVTRGQNWDPSLKRNNIFKAADVLGIKLPSMMF